MTVEPKTMNSQGPKSKRDLKESECRFLSAMQELGYGRFESLRILRGELVLEPWPTTIRSVKFGNPTPNRPPDVRPLDVLADFTLKDRIAEFFVYVRAVDSGIIRSLEVRGGLPFAMEVAGDPTAQTARNDLSPVQS